jgi:hypothetical protein
MNETLNRFAKTWGFRRPTLTRYLQTKYVDEFFNEGILQLSSFKVFRKHPDEERVDIYEGRPMLQIGRPNGSFAIVGINAAETYILCTTSVECLKMEASFDTSDGFRITNSLAFAECISRCIPGYIWGIEGFCDYRDNLLIEKYDSNPIKGPDEYGSLEEWERKTDEYVGQQMIDGFFLKRLKYAHQSEFRMIWCGSGKEQKYLKITCPEARKFCQRLKV